TLRLRDSLCYSRSSEVGVHLGDIMTIINQICNQTLIGVMITISCARPGRPISRDPEGLSNAANEPMRSVRSERDIVGPESAPPIFALSPMVWRSKDASAEELHDGDTVRNGDRIRVLVRTSENAFVYLAYCEGSALTIYPSERGILAHGQSAAQIPEDEGA